MLSYYITKTQMENIRKVLKDFKDLIDSFIEQLDKIERRQVICFE